MINIDSTQSRFFVTVTFGLVDSSASFIHIISTPMEKTTRCCPDFSEIVILPLVGE